LRFGIGGSLRWHDPDRFDGFDLSRATCAAPQCRSTHHHPFRGLPQEQQSRIGCGSADFQVLPARVIQFMTQSSQNAR
jgi:hypothetical protein